MKDKYDRKISN